MRPEGFDAPPSDPKPKPDSPELRGSQQNSAKIRVTRRNRDDAS